jgi:FkbM family methyltransferase
MSSVPKPVDLDGYLAVTGTCQPYLDLLFSKKQELIIFDIGACEGEDSIRYARQFPRARVYTFEPLPENQAIIRHNFTRYLAERAELVPIALSDRTGHAVLNISAGRPSDLFAGDNWNYGNKSSSLLPPVGAAPMHGWIDFPKKIEVACDTLDSFCTNRGIPRIDFIHMDVQGAEALVLNGATLTLPRIGALWLEVANEELYSGQTLRPQIEALLKKHGFMLIFEDRRGIEGDQFYVNRRHARSWLLLLRHTFKTLFRKLVRRLLKKT